MIVIGISGVAGVGKDVGAQALVRELGFTRIAFADTLREALYRLNPLVRSDDGRTIWFLRELIDVIGWERAKREFKMIRELLQRMGTEVGRQLIDDNVWVDVVFNRAQREGVDRLVIPDVRFPNELSAVQDTHGGACFRVKRPGYEPINDHLSDNALTDADFVFLTIINDGSEAEYQAKVIEMAHKWFPL